MSTVIQAVDQRHSGWIQRSGVVPERIFINAVRFMRALVTEISRIPSYQDEATRRRDSLRRR